MSIKISILYIFPRRLLFELMKDMRCSIFFKGFKLLLFILFLTSSFSLKAETKPRWVTKGVKELNKQRTNTTYSFQIVHLQDERKSPFEYDVYTALETYVDSTYHISGRAVKINPVESEEGEINTYVINFEKEEGPVEIYARLVDSFKQFEDFPSGAFDYNIWQLFAISEPNVYPEYDDFIIKNKYPLTAMAMSIIPGLGQIYKGQKAKGYVIMGAEVFFVGSIIYATTQMHRYNRLAYQHPDVFDSYQSKRDSYKAWRTFSFITGGGLYVYNLLDAALSKGARYIQIKRKNQPSVQLSFYPSYILDSPALTVGFNF